MKYFIIWLFFRLYWGKLPLDVNFCTYYFVMWEKNCNKKGRGSTYVLSVLYTTNLRSRVAPQRCPLS